MLCAREHPAEEERKKKKYCVLEGGAKSPKNLRKKKKNYVTALYMEYVCIIYTRRREISARMCYRCEEYTSRGVFDFDGVGSISTLIYKYILY